MFGAARIQLRSQGFSQEGGRENASEETFSRRQAAFSSPRYYFLFNGVFFEVVVCRKLQNYQKEEGE